MNNKYILGGLLMSGLLLTGCQSQVKQSVSAETKESISLQQEEVKEETTAASNEESATTQEAEKETTSTTLSSETSETKSTSESSTSSSVETLPFIEEATEESAKAPEEEQPPAVSIPEAAKDAQSGLPEAKMEENYQFSVAKNQTTEEFIQTIGKDAQQIAWDKGLYASVMIAQAILETGSGNSQLAQPPHYNLFGIKGSYQGKQVSFATKEDKGNGQLYTIQSAFRQYPSYKESLEDYAALLKNGVSGNAGFYQATWKEIATTYKEATKALTGRYATDTSYDKKLNALIETYDLTTYDQEPNLEKESKMIDSSEKKQDQKTPTRESDSELKESDKSDESKVRVSKTKQSVQRLTPITQQPAKQISGKRIAQ